MILWKGMLLSVGKCTFTFIVVRSPICKDQVGKLQCKQKLSEQEFGCFILCLTPNTLKLKMNNGNKNTLFINFPPSGSNLWKKKSFLGMSN